MIGIEELVIGLTATTVVNAIVTKRIMMGYFRPGRKGRLKSRLKLRLKQRSK